MMGPKSGRCQELGPSPVKAAPSAASLLDGDREGAAKTPLSACSTRFLLRGAAWEALDPWESLHKGTGTPGVPPGTAQSTTLNLQSPHQEQPPLQPRVIGNFLLPLFACVASCLFPLIS